MNKRLILSASVVGLLLLLAGAGIYALKLEARLWYGLKMWLTVDHSQSTLQLNRYQVTIDGLPIAGIDSDLSGLTFNQQTGTLFSVLNGEPLVVEISPDGRLLRQIQVHGVQDMEGISHIDGPHFVLADEANHRLIWVQIDDTTLQINTEDAPQISLDLQQRRNKSFEGVSWDEKHQRLLVVEERNPPRLLQITGFIDKQPDMRRLGIAQLASGALKRLALRDLSSVTHGPVSDSLLLLSDESRLLAEYDSQGQLLSYLSLWRGAHGLRQSIPQAEGVALGPDNQVFIISEPNLFYLFEQD